MDFYEVVKKRYSCRKYLNKKVEDEKIQKIFDAVRFAPTARNYQEWKFYLIRDERKKAELQVAAKNQSFISQADIVIVGVGTNIGYTMTCGYPAYVIDLAIAMEHLALAATTEGLGTCWIGAFYKDKVKEILNLGPDEEPVQLMTLGYPADEYINKKRKEIEEIIIEI